MEYRVLAELIRELRLLIPLGGGRPLPRTPTHLAVYGDPAQTWMYWHLRAIARATGIPSVRATPAYLGESLGSLLEIAESPRRRPTGFSPRETISSAMRTYARAIALGFAGVVRPYRRRHRGASPALSASQPAARR